MTGKILIIDTIRHYGKILLADGRESALQSFPASYETGDIATVKFIQDDPSKKVLSISVEAEDVFYGNVFVPSKDGLTNYISIITSYPRLMGLVQYNPNELDFIPSRDACKVKFQIHKNEKGFLSAHQIQLVSDKERFKCTTPVFGKIGEEHQPVLDGFVKRIVKEEIIPGDYGEGKITNLYIKNRGQENEYEYGFIKDKRSNKEIYFKVAQYKDVYRQKAQVGTDVIYKTNMGEDKYFISTFYEELPKRVIPLDGQYCFVKIGPDEYRLKIQEFRALYGTNPTEGDIVRCTVSGKNLKLVNTQEQEINQNIFYGVNPRLKSSDQGYGKAIQLECGEDNFTNFANPSADELYLAYINQAGKVEEIFKADLDSLPVAIAYYKTENKDKRFRLQAINTMIKANFKDSKINSFLLAEERISLLNELVSEATEKNLEFQLSEYQYQLQMLKYDPKSLKRCPDIAKPYLIEMDRKAVVEPPIDNAPWDINLNNPQVKEEPACEAWSIRLDDVIAPISTDYQDAMWTIDQKQGRDIPSIKPTDTYYNITL